MAHARKKMDLSTNRTPTSRITKNGKSQPTKLSKNGAYTRRYVVQAPTSEVDETLFGRDRQSASEVKNLAKAGPRTQNSSAPITKAENPKTVLVISNTLIRELRIPNKDPSEQSIIICQSEFERILANSRVLTKEDRDAALESKHKAQEDVKNAAEERKMNMQQADLARQKNQPLSDLEAEAKEHAQNILDKAKTLRMEREGDIMRLNQLILGVKCQEERDAQIEEKQKILSEKKEEQCRLDAMMETDRQKALEVQAHQDQLRKDQRIQGKICNMKQIEARQEERLLQEELKEQEKQQMLEKVDRWNMEKSESLKKKKEEQEKLRREIVKNSEASLRAKEQRKEEERLVDLNAMEYTRKKLEQKEAYEVEQTRKRREREKEVAKLRLLQEKAKDHKAERDALMARRHQDAVEREWRKKEKEQAKKKLQEQERLKTACLEYIAHKERTKAVEAGQKKAELNRLQRVQKELTKQDKDKQQQKRQRARLYGQELQHQMQARTAQTATQKRETFLERKRMEEEACTHQTNVDKYKEKTLKDLKEYGLPAKYYSSVSRKTNVLIKPPQRVR